MGYVGSVLTGVLHKKFEFSQIVGFDTGFFGHSLTDLNLYPDLPLATQFFGDVRDIKLDQLEGVDAVVHLAAISNDPMGNEFEEVTSEINRFASVRLVDLAAQAGVKNFVFASSCSMYGQTDGGPRKESDLLNPLTAYAKSKVGVEEDVKKINLGKMVFTSLRFATACGWSPRLRLDLVLNDFVACAITSKKITVLSDGTPWRPLIDVEDMCRAITWGIIRESDNGGQFLAVNAGCDENNYQVRDLAEAVAAKLPSTTVSINRAAQHDSRSYSVDFSLYKRLAPSYQPKVGLMESIDRMAQGLSSIGFCDENFRDSRFVRLNTLKNHIKDGFLKTNLRWIFRERSGVYDF
jgi:nucleoside-diphosphate-sugar epimerase